VKDIGAKGMESGIRCKLFPKQRQVPGLIFQGKNPYLQPSLPRPIQNRHGQITGPAGDVEHAELSQAAGGHLFLQSLQQMPLAPEKPIEAAKVQQAFPHLFIGHSPVVQLFLAANSGGKIKHSG
jgi:hypothetical protein